jgi:hypothetical protein
MKRDNVISHQSDGKKSEFNQAIDLEKEPDLPMAVFRSSSASIDFVSGDSNLTLIESTQTELLYNSVEELIFQGGIVRSR